MIISNWNVLCRVFSIKQVDFAWYQSNKIDKQSNNYFRRTMRLFLLTELYMNFINRLHNSEILILPDLDNFIDTAYINSWPERFWCHNKCRLFFFVKLLLNSQVRSQIAGSRWSVNRWRHCQQTIKASGLKLSVVREKPHKLDARKFVESKAESR